MPENDILKEVFQHNLKRLLDQKQSTQKDLARYMRVSPATVNDWIRGRKLPRMDKVDRLCEYFNVPRSTLMEKISPAPDDLPTLNAKDEREITRMMDDMKDKLMQEEGLMFDGQPATAESIQSILDAMQIGMEMAKKRNKAKYTPKKFRHED